LPNTLGVTVDDVCYHGRAVARGARRAHIVGDMPFMSFQVSADKALESAGQMVKNGGFEAVKLEGGEVIADQVRRIVDAGSPVMGHVGLLPQSVHAMGGFRVQGKSEDAALRVLSDARVLEQAGAYAIVLEGLPAPLAKRITETVSVPTIGIGAGVDCDGQVLVCYDFLGMYREVQPKFVKRFAELGQGVVDATAAYVAEVRSGTFPTKQHSFGLNGSGHAPAKPAPTPRRDGEVEAAGYGPTGD
jgi:3-methyl-2-oxobutanoate hydroxymethyltransferase